MLQHDLDLRASDIQLLSDLKGIANFFASLSYEIDRLPQTLDALGIGNASLRSNVRQIERIVSYDSELEIYFIELKSVTVANTQALARAFKDLAGEFLLVLTDDYNRIDFVLLERLRADTSKASLSVRPRVLTVDRRNPSTQALRVLRRFSFTESDPFTQYDKLLSAYTVAEWSAIYYNNRALFSDYYLDVRLQDSEEWGKAAKTIAPIYRDLQPHLIGVREKLSGKGEAATIEALYHPLLEQLKFRAEPGKTGEAHLSEPDFRLYDGKSEKPIALMLAYAWNRNLDTTDPSRDAENGNEVPGTKVVTLLDAGEADWVIVTNGKLWRLYSAKAHSRATNYYEIDLEEALTGEGALDGQERGVAFLYWWLFFRADAFIPREVLKDGKPQTACFLDRVIEGSEDYAKALGERLKNRVFEDIFPYFAQGFVVAMKRDADDQTVVHGYTEADLNLVFHATLTLLYRLMFLLYAESRNLLPIQEARGYYEISLKKLKDEIAEKGGAISDQSSGNLRKHYSARESTLWPRLQTLFAAIDRGDAAYNMPQYNGGLFITDPGEIAALPDGIEKQAAELLLRANVPDQFIAQGLDFLARDFDPKTKTLVAIDFKSLGVRQLGSIYEGLLEFKLSVATQKMAVVMEDKVEKVIPYDEAKKKKLRIKTIPRGLYSGDHFYAAHGDHPGEIVYGVGSVYLTNTKQERKATGSYYTPDYIVKYIVQHTVGPVLDEKFKALTPRLRDAQKKHAEARKRAEGFIKSGMPPDDPEKVWNDPDMQTLAHDVFDLKVLDPAMGSGHFLVEAVDYVTDRIIRFLQGFPANPVVAALRQTRTTILENLAKQNVSIDPSRLTDVALLKRQVLKRCVYGVDLNPMAVELAKVSLWLDAFTLGAPLSFLDHHLKCGNSLIGARIKDVQAALDQPGQLSLLAQSQFTGLMLATDLMAQVGDLPDVTIEQNHKSKNAYKEAYRALEPFKRILDMYTSRWFGNAPSKPKGKTKQVYDPAIEFLRRDDMQGWIKDPTQATIPAGDYMKAGQIATTAQTAAKDKRFFHWELEFPEVFFKPGSVGAPGQANEQAGFDAVVGNPPYGLVFDEVIKDYLEKRCYAFIRNNDIYAAFSQIGLEVLSPKRHLSFIVPNTFILGPYFNNLKEIFLKQARVFEIIDFGTTPIFEDPNVFSATFTVSNEQVENQQTLFKDAIVADNKIVIWMEAILGLANIPLEHWRPLNPILAKVTTLSITLNDLCLVKDVGFNYWSIGRGKQRGGSIGSRILYEGERQDKRDIPFIKGSSFTRFGIPTVGEYWLKHEYQQYLDPETDIFRYSPEFLQVPKKIVYRQTSDAIVAAIDNQGLLVDKTVHVVNLRASSEYYYEYLAALLNSRLTDFIYRELSHEEGRTFAQVKTFRVKQLPIRRIDFTTLAERRAELSEKGRKLYARCLSEGHACVLEFVAHHLAAGETDVVHDLLAFLAQQMIDLNKQKQAEMKRFLDWFAAALRIKPTAEKTGWDVLTGKTDILDYLGDYQKGEPEKTWVQIMDRLTQNRTKIGADLSDTSKMQALEREYEKSLGVLKPIKAQLATTDALIDQVVYKLYGLTDEEIGIVEGRG